MFLPNEGKKHIFPTNHEVEGQKLEVQCTECFDLTNYSHIGTGSISDIRINSNGLLMLSNKIFYFHKLVI